MRINRKFITVISLLLLTATLITIMSGCKKGDEPYKPPVITTQYTVSYYQEDGTTLIETRTFTHGDYITYPNVTKDGYMANWKLYNESGEEVGVDKAIQNTKAVVYYELMDALVTVYDSSTSEEIFNRYYYYGDTFSVGDITAEINIEKPGYVFKGFSDDGGKTFNTTFLLKDGSITLEAIYEPIIYKLTFFDDETYRVIYPTSETVYGDITLPAAPAKEGHTFDGWYVVDGFTTKKAGGKGDTYTVKGDTNFYAVYVKTPTENNSGTTEK